MATMKQFSRALLALLLLISLAPSALAASTKGELEAVYGLPLTGDKGQYTGSQATAYLEQTELALRPLGAAFVRSVSDYYKTKGYSVAFSLKTADWDELLGHFSFSSSPKYAKIVILTNGSDGNPAVSSSTAAHEFGHMLNYALDLKLGTSTVKSRWEALSTEADVFISDYASTSYREDIAETFMSLIDDPGSFYFYGADSAPMKKLLLLDELLSENFPAYPGLASYHFYLPQSPSPWSADTIALMGEKDMLLSPPLYQAPITRGEFCELVVRMTENLWQRYDPQTLWPILPERHDEISCKDYFSDVPFSGQIIMGINPEYFINRAYELGIINGTGTAADGRPIFNAEGLITRDAAAKMLTEACRVMGRDTAAVSAEPYADAADFQAWSVPYIDYMRQSGIMGGTGGNAFSPGLSYSYEQAYATIWRIIQNGA